MRLYALFPICRTVQYVPPYPEKFEYGFFIATMIELLGLMWYNIGNRTDRKIRICNTEVIKMVFIDKAQLCDLKAILELQYLAYQSEAKLFGNMDIPPLMQTIEEVCEEFQKGTVLKAVDDSGDIIGSVRAYEENGTVYIGKLMVHPKMQKQGIGTQLLLAMENEFPNCRYELFTSTKSISNIRLYERLGYKIFKEESVSEELQFVYLEKC